MSDQGNKDFWCLPARHPAGTDMNGCVFPLGTSRKLTAMACRRSLRCVYPEPRSAPGRDLDADDLQRRTRAANGDVIAIILSFPFIIVGGLNQMVDCNRLKRVSRRSSQAPMVPSTLLSPFSAFPLLAVTDDLYCSFVKPPMSSLAEADLKQVRSDMPSGLNTCSESGYLTFAYPTTYARHYDDNLRGL